MIYYDYYKQCFKAYEEAQYSERERVGGCNLYVGINAASTQNYTRVQVKIEAIWLKHVETLHLHIARSVSGQRAASSGEHLTPDIQKPDHIHGSPNCICAKNDARNVGKISYFYAKMIWNISSDN